jgi:hypothetical protein
LDQERARSCVADGIYYHELRRFANPPVASSSGGDAQPVENAGNKAGEADQDQELGALPIAMRVRRGPQDDEFALADGKETVSGEVPTQGVDAAKKPRLLRERGEPGQPSEFMITVPSLP